MTHANPTPESAPTNTTPTDPTDPKRFVAVEPGDVLVPPFPAPVPRLSTLAVLLYAGWQLYRLVVEVAEVGYAVGYADGRATR